MVFVFVWFISLSMIISKSIHVAVNDIISFFKIFLLQLLYNVVLFSAVQQSESAICICVHTHIHTHIYIPYFQNFRSMQVTTEHWVEFPVHQETVCSHQLSILYIVSVYAKVGSQEIPGVTDKFGLGVQNEEEQRLIVFCQENALVIANTLFQQHKRQLYTWT